jgi:N-acetylneuraminate lyase
MDHDGGVAYDRVKPMVRHLLAQGVDGVFICGTTGEGMSLSLAERFQLAETWREAVGSLPLIVHVGHTCTKDAQALAEHAQRIGADGIASIGPCFFEAGSAEVLGRYCGQIAGAAPETPFYYYHMPSMARVTKVKASDALACMAADIPNFAGIKFTHEDMDDYRRCLELSGGRWDIFFGRDELLLDALRVGAVCAVGSTYNFATPLYRDIIRAYVAGDIDLAAQKQRLATAGINVLVQYGGLPAIKAMMACVGMDCGPMRLPLTLPSPAQIDAMTAQLEAMQYLSAIASPVH